MLNQAATGLFPGGIYCLIGICLLLVYRVGAVVNFSQALAGTFAAFAVTSLTSDGLPTWFAITAGLLLGAAIAVVQGMVMARYLIEASVLVRTGVSIAMAVTLFSLSLVIFGDNPRNFPVILGGKFSVGGIELQTAAILAWALAIVCGIALGLTLSRTRLGIVLRAIAHSAPTAETLGVRTSRYVVGVWAVAGLITTFAVILIAPATGSVDAMGLLVGPAVAAVLLGGFRRIWLTVLGALGIGLAEGVTPMISNTQLAQVCDSAVPFVVIAAVLFWSQRKVSVGDIR